MGDIVSLDSEREQAFNIVTPEDGEPSSWIEALWVESVVMLMFFEALNIFFHMLM